MYTKGGIGGDIRYLLWPMQVQSWNIWVLFALKTIGKIKIKSCIIVFCDI